MRVGGRTTLILRLPAAVRVANPALPVSARLCGSAPQYRAGRRPAGRCRRRNPAPSLRSPSPPPLRTQLPRRAERVAALRASVGVRARHPAASAFCGRGVSPLTPFAGVALRAKSAAAPPRSARTAPRPASAVAFALLSPPRETSRSICLTIARSGVPFPPPSCHSSRLALSTSPAARLRRRMARAARGPVSSKGARRRSLATPRLGRNFAARCACPLARIRRRSRRASFGRVTLPWAAPREQGRTHPRAKRTREQRIDPVADADKIQTPADVIAYNENQQLAEPGKAAELIAQDDAGAARTEAADDQGKDRARQAEPGG